MLLRQLQIGEGDDRCRGARQAGRARLAPLFADEGEAPVHLLGQLIGLDFSASPHVAGAAGRRGAVPRRAFEAGALCAAPAGRQPRPVVLVLDDLHWADDGSMDFMRFVHAARRATCRC